MFLLNALFKVQKQGEKETFLSRSETFVVKPIICCPFFCESYSCKIWP